MKPLPKAAQKFSDTIDEANRAKSFRKFWSRDYMRHSHWRRMHSKAKFSMTKADLKARLRLAFQAGQESQKSGSAP